jgi:hypothetical protein
LTTVEPKKADKQKTEKNIMTKKADKKISVSVNSSNVFAKNILSINRKSSIFVDYPTLPIELEALNRVYMSIGNRIAVNKAFQAQIDEKQQVINAIEAIAVQAWAAYHISHMDIPYLDQTRQQAIDIHHDMLRCINTMSDRNKLTVNNKQRTRNALTVNGNKSKTKNETLVINTIIQYNGCSFTELPVDVQAQFTANTMDMYNKLKPFYNTMRYGTGKKKFATLYQMYGDNLTDDILNEVKSPLGHIIGKDDKGEDIRIKTDTSSVRYMSLAINSF